MSLAFLLDEIRRRMPLREIIESLVIVAYASDPSKWLDRLEYLP